MAIEIRVPSLGESVAEATLGTWLRKPGQAVASGESLCELETDKVNLEVPAPAGGVLTEILAEAGDTVAPGAVLAMFEEGAAPEAAAADETPAPAAGSAPEADVEHAPSARKILAEKGVSPKRSKGPAGADGSRRRTRWPRRRRRRCRRLRSRRRRRPRRGFP